ncbi:MAG TPA: ATP-binding protein [Actinomycetota bacterium]|nr:ATP-binding protein [Actinomycetota bacterium]
MRPLDPLSSIKTKLTVVIVASVAVTVAVHTLGIRAGVPLVLVGIASGALALLMIQFLARGMTSPLREMASAAQSMARGDYSRRVTASSRDEVGDLARAFNSMASELEQVERMRRDLIANVSHELRTPISALQAVLENLIDGVEEPDPVTFTTMHEQVRRLGRLVTQLLDLSRLESGAVPLQRVHFRLDDLLQQAVRESKLHSHNVHLSVRVNPADLAADGDPERVHQVVANLIENAVRHSPDDAEVLVSARGDLRLVTIEVEDEGPGIPQHEASRVFERFYRADAARSSTQGGTGLGLAIARWIVDLHGGQIRVESRQPSGCRMVVELPGIAAP